MTRTHVYTLTLVGFILGLLLATLWLGGEQPVYAQQPLPEGQAFVQAPTGTAFTYQGRLLDNGQPMDGVPCRFVFTLWDAETGGSDLGTQDAVATLRNGYFAVELDFGQDVFSGEARWLSVRVRCPEPQGPWQDLQGRIPIRPAPYAMYAQRAGTVIPGATVKDTSGNKVGIYAQSGQDWVPPLSVALQTGGLWGDSQVNNGVIGTSERGNGLYGYSQYGKALYADGDAHVEGTLTWKAKTSYISLSPAAFQPSVNGLAFENNGYALRNYGTQQEVWVASVQLPHGARVKEISGCWKDASDDDASLSLVRRPLASPTNSVIDPADTMASVTSRGSKTTNIAGCFSDDTVSYNQVDNSNYSYYLVMTLPPTNYGNLLEFYGMQIMYEVNAPY